MPRTTKDTTKKVNTKTEKKVTKTTNKSDVEAKNKTTKKKVSTKTSTAKKSTKKKAATKTSTAKKTTKTTANKKTTSTKKAPSRTRKKTTTVEKIDKTNFVEYYDLPYRYNQTVVKVLAQTPQMLFVYWDISDEHRLLYINTYGENFFSKTRPVLLVHNETMNYTFEVEINDFANSWYLHVNDANCKYSVELGRRANPYQDTVKEEYIYITSSNKMDAPNDHILFEEFNPEVLYRDIKTGKEFTKNFASLSNLKSMQKIYGIYNLYKKIYKNELFDEIVDGNLSNSSSLSSSQFK